MLLKEFFYIPNILEYLRIILIYYGIIQKNFIFFILNYILDMLDGAIARYLNQTSYLGCFLDHFVDRLMICGPTILLLYNGSTNPALIFTILESITNIYFNFFTQECHMKHNKNKSFILRKYYSNNRHNLISYSSLVPYFIYGPLLYCIEISNYLSYLLQAGVFLYFLIWIEKLKFWLFSNNC